MTRLFATNYAANAGVKKHLRLSHYKILHM